MIHKANILPFLKKNFGYYPKWVILNVDNIDVFGIQKKLYKLSKLGGGNLTLWNIFWFGNMDKIQKKKTFFRETFPNQCKQCKQWKQRKQFIARCYLHLWRNFFKLDILNDQSINQNQKEEMSLPLDKWYWNLSPLYRVQKRPWQKYLLQRSSTFFTLFTCPLRPYLIFVTDARTMSV